MQSREFGLSFQYESPCLAFELVSALPRRFLGSSVTICYSGGSKGETCVSNSD